MIKFIRLRLIVIITIGLFFTGCVQWPSFIIGDSSGYIQYDRNTRRLEVLWEKHLEVKDTFHRSARVDSTFSEKSLDILSDK